jgi:hypothetical protein
MVSVDASEWTWLNSDKKRRTNVADIMPDIFSLVDNEAIVRKPKEGRLN